MKILDRRLLVVSLCLLVGCQQQNGPQSSENSAPKNKPQPASLASATPGEQADPAAAAKSTGEASAARVDDTPAASTPGNSGQGAVGGSRGADDAPTVQANPVEQPAAPHTVVAQAPAASGDDEAPRGKPGALPPNLWTRRAGVDWPTFLGPTGDSKSPEKGILTMWPKDGPRIVWQRKLGDGYGIGSISRGRMFQFDRVDNTARLVCLNAETGAELWQFTYPTNYVDLYSYSGGPRCSPVVDGDRVYIFGVEGMLHCLRTIDGKLIWKVDTNKEFGVVQNFFGVGSTPAIEGDLLIAMIGGSPAESHQIPPGQLDRVIGNGSGVVAFDKFTGKVKYKISDELASYASMKLADIDGRRWGLAFARGGLVGFEPKTGKVDFHYPWRDDQLESVNASTPVVVGKRVFISETYGIGSSLLEVKPGGYKVVWKDDPKKRHKAMQTHWNTPIHLDGYIYGCSGRHTNNAELRCIDLETGKVQWSEEGLSRGSLLYADGHFFYLEEYGTLYLLRANPKKFDVVAKVLLTEKIIGPQPFDFQPKPLLKFPAWAAPILSHGLLYLRGADRLVCMELIPEKRRQ